MDMNHLKESEIVLIQKGLELLSDQMKRDAKLSASLNLSVESVESLVRVSNACEELNIKISNYNKGE